MIDLFSFSFELAKNEDEKVAEYGRLFIEYLLEQPDFPSVRKNYFSDEGDLKPQYLDANNNFVDSEALAAESPTTKEKSITYVDNKPTFSNNLLAVFI